MTLQFNLAAKRELPKLKPLKDINELLAQLHPPEPYQPVIWSKTRLYRVLGKKITDPVVRKQLRNIIGNYIKTNACKVNTNATDIDHAMTWHDTPHGHDFWSYANKKWTPHKKAIW